MGYKADFIDLFEKANLPVLLFGKFDTSDCPENYEYIANPQELIGRIKELDQLFRFLAARLEPCQLSHI